MKVPDTNRCPTDPPAVVVGIVPLKVHLTSAISTEARAELALTSLTVRLIADILLTVAVVKVS